MSQLSRFASEALRRGLIAPRPDPSLQRALDAETQRKCEGLLNDTFPEQKKAILEETQRDVIVGPRRGAKTETWLRRTFRKMLLQPFRRAVYGSDTKKHAKEIAHDRILTLGGRYGLNLKVNHTELRYTLPNGSSMFMFGLNDVADLNKLRGNAYDDIGVDEVQSIRTDIEEFTQSVANPALLDRRGHLAYLGTPDPKRVNKFWSDAIRLVDKRWHRHWWPLTANTFLRDPAGYLAEMLEREGYTEDDPRFRAEFLGDVEAHDTSNVMFQDYLDLRNRTLALPGGKQHHVAGYDIGLVDRAAVAIWAYDFHTRGIWLVETFARSGLGIDDQGAILTAMATKYPYLDVAVDEGALGKLIALELAQRFPGLSLHAADKSNKALQVSLMNSDFRTGRIKLAGPATQHEINPKTKGLLIEEQWKNTLWDEKHQREQEGQEVDLLDAALYGWRACKTYIDNVAPKPVVDTWEQQITDHDRGRKVQHFTRENR